MQPFPVIITDTQVRDLAWACFGPDLLTPLPESDVITLCPETQAWLQALDTNPAKLHDFLANCSHRHRLGLYYEALWHFFLSEHPHYALLEHNLPVKVAGRTLGELDIVYQNRATGRIIHLELAIKFYLGITGNSNEASMADWWGPNTRDRLDRKVNRLLSHQLPLSAKPETQSLLASRGISHCQRQMCVKGMLFQPAGQPLSLPEQIAPGASLAEWMTLRSFQSRWSQHAWQILERRQWLRPLQAGEFSQLLQGEALLAGIAAAHQQHQRPVLLARAGQTTGETGRCFVSPDDWPHHRLPG